jgi:copper(I)-binding protein
MIKHFAFLLPLLAAISLAPVVATAHSHKRKNLEIVHPWTPEMPQKGVTTARVFMTVKNGSRTSERLISASTPRAEKVELSARDSAASEAAFAIGPGKELALRANGPHLVLTGVRKAFRAYDEFKMTLVFEKAGRMVVDVVVEESDEGHQH